MSKSNDQMKAGLRGKCMGHIASYIEDLECDNERLKAEMLKLESDVEDLGYELMECNNRSEL